MTDDVPTRSGQIRWHSSSIVSNYKLDEADIDNISKNRWNALHYASQIGSLKIVESILNIYRISGVYNIDARTSDGQTALSLATYEGHEDVVELLLENGADINLIAVSNPKRSSDSTWTLLHHASHRGWIKVVQTILDKSDLDAKTEEGMTALMLAAKMEHQDIAGVLLLSGAGLGGVDEDKWTVLHHAAYKGWLSVVELILERQPNLEDETYHGQTALFLSASMGHREVVELLMESGASLDCCDWNQWTLLHHASYRGWTEIVEHIVLKGECNIDARVFLGETALMLAMEYKQYKVAKLLVKHGADVNMKLEGYMGETVLTSAITRGSSASLISLLVKNGAYFKSIDYEKICQSSFLEKRLLKDRDICIQAVVNEYNNACLPAVKELSDSCNIVLPSINFLKINGGNMLQEIEKMVDHEIETKSICNVMKVRPFVLQMMAVRSLLDYCYC